ncbi:MAG: xanthine phosphoribosyltransferase [Bacillota bacterium]
MNILQQRIASNGTQVSEQIVKVDSFLNHQLDIGLFMLLGKEIFHKFGHLNINKILTVESSSIGIASIAAIYFDLVPVVFAKNSVVPIMAEDMYTASVTPLITETKSTLHVARQYLTPTDRVLVLDDFIASGETASGLCSLVEQANATVCGVAAIIEKEFQGGSARLKNEGYLVDSLAVITKMDETKIYFKD